MTEQLVFRFFHDFRDHRVSFMNSPSLLSAHVLSGFARTDRLLRRSLWALLGILLLTPAPAKAESYELGEGYRLPWLGLTAGGYASVQANDLENQKARAAVQDLSLFLYSDPTPDWHFFSEIEVSNPLFLTSGGLSIRDADLDFERFYVDYNLAPRQTVRLGKFLTPIGRWNQIHADPLVWTVSRPLTTAAPFARNASGIQLYGSEPLAGSAIDYQVYLDDSSQLDPTEGHEQTYIDLNVRPNPASSFQQGSGMRLQYRTIDDALLVGLSAARYRLKDLPSFKDLFGLDVFYTHNDMEISGESVYRQDEGSGGGEEWGGFIQLVAPIANSFYAIAYHERYKAELFSGVLNTTSFGITYRPKPALSIKLEYRNSWGQENLAPSGWLFSVATLF
jgi:hypothetical protein